MLDNFDMLGTAGNSQGKAKAYGRQDGYQEAVGGCDKGLRFEYYRQGMVKGDYEDNRQGLDARWKWIPIG